ncbi:MAG TPA: class I SAM-dependent methyltransferase [Candidatus Paceibacterota bacterium]|nr:class I SAM-dependent methyltransferase [Candidatus Paceibacterota bacterium]
MILKTEKQNDYELIDSGNGEKLERYGSYILKRPDPEAIWEKSKNISDWEKAELKFVRNGIKTNLPGRQAGWVVKEGTPKSWNISYGSLKFSIKPTSFKHTGLFPEQLPNWQWTEELIKKESKNRKVEVLNLFAYTGGATLACAKAGAEVCHVDGSKTAVEWARENAKLSGLENASTRWIVEDVIKFLKREVKRGHKYDAIIMDPPSFGHGPKDELWKIEENFLELMKLCKEVLSSNPLFILINGYTAGYSPIAYQNNLKDMMKNYKGIIESGELVIEQTGSDILLPCGIFARWSRGN